MIFNYESKKMSYNEIYNRMTEIYNGGHHKQRGEALYNCIKYVAENNIPGDFVECGVADGRSSCIALLSFLSFGLDSKIAWLYDTYEGDPGRNNGGFKDIVPLEWEKDFKGRSVNSPEIWSNFSRPQYGCESSSVINTLLKTGYPQDQIKAIKGKVEDTIPKNIPGSISILRLDTDLYTSTKHELENLYPLLSNRGYLIIDDYGHFSGPQKAVDDFFEGRVQNSYMADYTALVHQKIVK